MTGTVSEAMKTPESEIECAITNPRILNVSEMFVVPSIQVICFCSFAGAVPITSALHASQALQQSNPLLYKTLEVFAYGTLKDLPQEVCSFLSFFSIADRFIFVI